MIKPDEIIKILNQCQLKIVEIWHPNDRVNTLRYFSIISFQEPINSLPHYVLKGLDITDVICSDSLSIHTLGNRNRTSSVLTKMEQLSVQVKEFSKDFSYIYHLSTEE